jgi:DNA-binding transcriptional ArsR family regulator
MTNETIKTFMEFYYPAWTPPSEVGVRKHRIMQDNYKSESKQPVHARTKILAALHKFDWMTVEKIATETGLAVSTVARTTDRMYAAKKIERKREVNPAHGKINLYRKK